MYQYPYGNSQQLNLDWILNKLKELEAGSADLEEIANALISDSYAVQNYNLSDIVFYNGKLHRANQNITAEAWNPAHWDEILLGDTVANLVRAVAGMNSDDVFNESNVSGTYVTDALNALVEDIRYNNHYIQQKKNGVYSDAIEIEDTPSNSSDKLASSKAVYDLKDTVNNNAIKTMLPVNPCIKESRLIAHQGSTSFVQSSDLCFKNAIMQGFKILEGDVQKTSDNKFVIWHDSTAGGLTVATSTLAQLQALTLDYGCKVLSLEDFVKLAIENSVAVELDLTTSHFSDVNFTTYAQTIYNAVKAINPSLDSVIWTINYAKALVLETIDPSVIICYSGLANVGAIGDNVKRLIKNSRLFMFSQNKSSIDPDVVAWSHNNGVLIKAYTTTSEAELFNAFASGADCAIVEAVLPHINDYLFITNDISSWIYDARVTLDTNPVTSGIRMTDNNILQITIHCVLAKTLTSSQRSLFLMPSFLRPLYPNTGVCLAGSNVAYLDKTLLVDYTQSGYINVTHGGNLSIGDHIIATLYAIIPPFTSVFTS